MKCTRINLQRGTIFQNISLFSVFNVFCIYFKYAPNLCFLSRSLPLGLQQQANYKQHNTITHSLSRSHTHTHIQVHIYIQFYFFNSNLSHQINTASSSSLLEVISLTLSRCAALCLFRYYQKSQREKGAVFLHFLPYITQQQQIHWFFLNNPIVLCGGTFSQVYY